MGEFKMEADVVVIGAGPGGYVAAIRAADLGKSVIIVEERQKLGGVCLIEGCIPSKTLIHAVELKDDIIHAEEIGLSFKEVGVDLDKLRKWTIKVVDGLTSGIDTLLTKRGVEIVHGHAHFNSNKLLAVEGVGEIEFKNAIIATGSSLNKLPEGYVDSVWSSSDALKLPFVPENLLVVGGGYIGLEMGLVYSGLGSKVTMVEFMPHLLMGADQDMVRVVVKHAKKKFENIMTDSKVTEVVEKKGGGYKVTIEHNNESKTLEFDQVLVAIGRRPNTFGIGLENTNIKVNDRGFIVVDEEGRTSEPNIFAIGDVTPGPMLAHKASREGKVAAEVIGGEKAAFDNRTIPAVVFTDPELAWTGLTEQEAEKEGIPYKLGKFPLTALGRAKSIGKTDGFVKILAEPDTNLVLGMGIVGPSASELIAEGTLAIEMGATLEDLIVSIHPHPTISESIMEAAEMAAGVPVHTLPPRKNK
ncbi:dihydrolipoyl dehydrogenase [bacterium]|nr:dihydrolipoyl dehydrogenase [bacterium]